MAITTEQKYLLNNKMGKVAHKVQLGDLIEDAEEGGLANDAVSLEHLDAGIEPSHIVKFAGKHTTTADALAPHTNAVTVTGVLATDIVIFNLQTEGATPVTVKSAIPSADTITFAFGGDPSTDHIVAYTVLRAAS